MEKSHFQHYFPIGGFFFNDKPCVMTAVLVCRCAHVYTYIGTEETDPFVLV